MIFYLREMLKNIKKLYNVCEMVNLKRFYGSNEFIC